jgi:hypothetical protein
MKAEVPHANIYHYLKGSISVCGAPITVVDPLVTYVKEIDITDFPVSSINLSP